MPKIGIGQGMVAEEARCRSHLSLLLNVLSPHTLISALKDWRRNLLKGPND